MATLAEQRAANGARVSSARAATGGAERAAIGQRLVSERTGRSIQNDLNALSPSPRKQAGLRKLEPLGARPATSSPALNRKQPVNATGGGIASPLTETPDTREWWTTGWPSSDGIFEYPAEKKVTMTDANGADVILEYVEPA
jgi:hypothetical protein